MIIFEPSDLLRFQHAWTWKLSQKSYTMIQEQLVVLDNHQAASSLKDTRPGSGACALFKPVVESILESGRYCLDRFGINQLWRSTLLTEYNRISCVAGFWDLLHASE